MSQTGQHHGQCLCGKVTLTAAQVDPHAGACHCSMCRKWGGSALMVVECGTEVSFGGESFISVFDSSPWAERAFCSQCGTHLFYRLKDSQQYMVPVGVFDDLTEVQFRDQIFIDEKPEYYSFANPTKNLTGAEVFAMYAPPSP